jgi:sulfate transport system permease protein
LSAAVDTPAGAQPGAPAAGAAPAGNSAGRTRSPRRVLARLGLRSFVILYLALLIAVPLGSIVYRAFRPGLSAAWTALVSPGGQPAEYFWHALVLTIEVAAVAVPLNAAFGVGVAILLARHRFPGARILDAAVDLPLAVSPVVIGLALYLVYDTKGWIGHWLAPHGIAIIFSVPGIVLASAFVSVPYVARAVLPVLQEIGTDQEQAASTLGAGPFTTLWRVTLPSIRWGLAYGVTLTTARILGEFGAVSVVSGDIQGKTQTLTLYVGSQFSNFNQVGADMGALVLAVIALCVLGLLSLSKSKERSSSWRSKSATSRNDSAKPSPSNTSTSTSLPAR